MNVETGMMAPDQLFVKKDLPQMEMYCNQCHPRWLSVLVTLNVMDPNWSCERNY